MCTPELVAEHVAGHDVRVLLGPASELGRAATLRRDDLGRAVLPAGSTWSAPSSSPSRWSPTGCPAPGRAPRRTPPGWPGWPAPARARVPVVLSNAVRFADRLDAPTIDVLDAARRLVPMDARHLDRRNAEGFLKSGKQMHEVAEEICRYAGLGGPPRRPRPARPDPRPRRPVRPRPPRTTSGSGRCTSRSSRCHRPGTAARLRTTDAAAGRGCEDGIGWRYGNAPRQRIWKRLDDELETIRTLGYASYFLTVGDVTEMIRELGIRSAARGSGAGSLVNYLLGISGVDPIRHGLLMERFLSPLRRSLPDIDIDVESARRLEVYDAILERFGSERCAHRLDDGHLQGAPRDP